MNRDDRRRFTKGDKRLIQDRLKSLQIDVNTKHKNLNEALQSANRTIEEKSRHYASLVLAMEFMPIVRDVLAFDLKCDEERIALFERRFEERKNDRLNKIDLKQLQETEIKELLKPDEET